MSGPIIADNYVYCGGPTIEQIAAARPLKRQREDGGDEESTTTKSFDADDHTVVVATNENAEAQVAGRRRVIEPLRRLDGERVVEKMRSAETPPLSDDATADVVRATTAVERDLLADIIAG